MATQLTLAVDYPIHRTNFFWLQARMSMAERGRVSGPGGSSPQYIFSSTTLKTSCSSTPTESFNWYAMLLTPAITWNGHRTLVLSSCGPGCSATWPIGEGGRAIPTGPPKIQHPGVCGRSTTCSVVEPAPIDHECPPRTCRTLAAVSERWAGELHPMSTGAPMVGHGRRQP
jgi:hypothetical protein